jgi:hypothetical protein
MSADGLLAAIFHVGCAEMEKVKLRLERSSPISAISRRNVPGTIPRNSFYRSFCWMRFYTARVITGLRALPIARLLGARQRSKRGSMSGLSHLPVVLESSSEVLSLVPHH